MGQGAGGGDGSGGGGSCWKLGGFKTIPATFSPPGMTQLPKTVNSLVLEASASLTPTSTVKINYAHKPNLLWFRISTQVMLALVQ